MDEDVDSVDSSFDELDSGSGLGLIRKGTNNFTKD